MNMASLADMTRKLAFLLILASARKNSEVWAFSSDVHFGLVARKHKRPSGLLYSSGKLSFLPERFGQRRQNRASQHPNISSGVCCVPLWKAHGLYIQADSVRVDQTFDHSRLTRRVRMRIFLTQPTPTSKQESSEHLPLPWRSSQLFPK